MFIRGKKCHTFSANQPHGQAAGKSGNTNAHTLTLIHKTHFKNPNKRTTPPMFGLTFNATDPKQPNKIFRDFHKAIEFWINSFGPIKSLR